VADRTIERIQKRQRKGENVKGMDLTVLKKWKKAKVGKKQWTEDLHKMIADYGATGDVEVLWRDHWANAEGVYEILRKWFKLRREVFASPWNATGVFEEYCSQYDIDQHFGATGSAWDCDWNVPAVVNPMYTKEDMLRAVQKYSRG